MKAKLFWVDGAERRLAIMARPRGNDWLDDDILSLRSQRINAIVSLLIDEEIEELGLSNEGAASKQLGIDFLRYPIADRSVPINEIEFRSFLEGLMSRYRRGQSIAIHCRMGIGRSSLVAACMLVRLGVVFPDAFDRIGQARGCTVPDTPTQAHWVMQFTKT